MKNIIKIKEKKLKKYEFSGNFLYKNKKTFFFSDKIYNTLLINESENIATENLTDDFENYLTNFFTACGLMKNKPSILFLGEPEHKEKYTEALGDAYVEITNKKRTVLLEKSPSIYFVKDEKYFVELLEKLFETRTDVIAPNIIYIVIDKPENYNLKSLHAYLTLTRSRRMHISLFVYDNKKFIKQYSPEKVDIIKNYCLLKFTCDNNDILSIEINKNEIKN